MHMVRHHAPGKQPIARAVEIEEGILDKGGDLRPPQEAFSVTGAEQRLKACASRRRVAERGRPGREQPGGSCSSRSQLALDDGAR
jgi:hypothetical protein